MFVEVYERCSYTSTADDSVVLNHELREKGRFKTTTEKGVEIRFFLERGKTLTIGEHLKTRCGKIIVVAGANESVIRAQCADWQTFSQACYHLGNRHVKIEIGDRWLRIKPDYVLEDLLSRLGLSTIEESAIFTPESGAYSGGHHHH